MIDLDVMRAQWAPMDGGLYLAAINLQTNALQRLDGPVRNLELVNA